MTVHRRHVRRHTVILGLSACLVAGTGLGRTRTTTIAARPTTIGCCSVPARGGGSVTRPDQDHEECSVFDVIPDDSNDVSFTSDDSVIRRDTAKQRRSTMGTYRDRRREKEPDCLARLRPIFGKQVAACAAACLAYVLRSLILVQQQLGEHVVPALVCTFYGRASSIRTTHPQLHLGHLYLLALLGSSVGFVHFVYFITYGYALGVLLPVVAAAGWCRSSSHRRIRVTPPIMAMVHAGLTVAWSLRLTAFLVWREFFSWPALHRNVVRLQSGSRPPASAQVSCWLTYAAMYACLASSSWYRLLANDSQSRLSRAIDTVAVLLQICGLFLETIADWQKDRFKAALPHNRFTWCNVGVWQWSTHPNYLGEWCFWLGSLLGAVAVATPHVGQIVVMAVGFAFITAVLQGATHSLDARHWQKYGRRDDFVAYRASHTLFGPRLPVPDVLRMAKWRKRHQQLTDVAANASGNVQREQPAAVGEDSTEKPGAPDDGDDDVTSQNVHTL